MRQGPAPMWGTLAKLLMGAAAAGIIVLAGVALGLWDVRVEFNKERLAGSATHRSEPADLTPREFLYVDNPRVAAYLSQLTGGIETLKQISESVTREGGVEVGVEPVKVTGKIGQEDAIERSVTPTAASNFHALITQLKDQRMLADFTPAPADGVANPQAASSVCPVRRQAEGDAPFAGYWCTVDDGEIVSFIAKVRRPAFVRVYLALRNAPRRSWLRRKGAPVLKAIGALPRLPLVAEMRTSKAGPRREQVLRIVLPAQSAFLSSEPSLFSSKVRIVGKVVRRVDRDAYRDLDFRRRFLPVLRLTPPAVRKRLNISVRDLRRDLRRYHAVDRPAAIVLPVAIFG